MTRTQEQAITLALDALQIGFFECPKQYFEYFISNDEWALLLAAAGLTGPEPTPKELALAVLRNAVFREGFFNAMTDFRPPAHFCSFLGTKMPSIPARQTTHGVLASQGIPQNVQMSG